jgi:hypothetical protein
MSDLGGFYYAVGRDYLENPTSARKMVLSDRFDRSKGRFLRVLWRSNPGATPRREQSGQARVVDAGHVLAHRRRHGAQGGGLDPHHHGMRGLCSWVRAV